MGTDGDGDKFIYRIVVENSSTDFRSFIAYGSEGLTEVGQKLFQESLESFNYCVLGAEATTRWSVVGRGAKSSQTQDVFRQLVEDTIVQNDSTVLISNMRKSIQATNVVLNLAVVPNVILMPSNFVILSKKIAGYNKVLTTATAEMKFGVNKDVNYSDPEKDKSSSISSGVDDDDNVHDGGGSINSNGNNSKFDRIRNSEATTGSANAHLAVAFSAALAAGLIMSKMFLL